MYIAGCKLCLLDSLWDFCNADLEKMKQDTRIYIRRYYTWILIPTDFQPETAISILSLGDSNLWYVVVIISRRLIKKEKNSA